MNPYFSGGAQHPDSKVVGCELVCLCIRDSEHCQHTAGISQMLRYTQKSIHEWIDDCGYHMNHILHGSSMLPSDLPTGYSFLIHVSQHMQPCIFFARNRKPRTDNTVSKCASCGGAESIFHLSVSGDLWLIFTVRLLALSLKKVVRLLFPVSHNSEALMIRWAPHVFFIEFPLNEKFYILPFFSALANCHWTPSCRINAILTQFWECPGIALWHLPTT